MSLQSMEAWLATAPSKLDLLVNPIDDLDKISTRHVIGIVMPRILDACPLYEIYIRRMSSQT